MASRYLEQPREIILSETIKISNEAYQKQNKRDLARTDRSIILPPIHQHQQRRRIQTQYSPDKHNQILQISSHLMAAQTLKMPKNEKISQIFSQLSKKISILEKMGVISGGTVKTIKYSGHIRIPTVHNDYHNSKTNSGYSRNKYGGIYPK